MKTNKVQSVAQPSDYKIFHSPYGYGIGKDNSDTQIFYFKTLEEAITKLADIAPNQVLRAVNQHDQLVSESAALRLTHKSLVDALNYLIFLSCNKYDDATWREAWIQASEAITKAEGQTEHSSEAERK